MNIRNEILSKQDLKNRITIIDVLNDSHGIVIEYTLDKQTKAYSATTEELCIELYDQGLIQKYFPMANGLWVTFETIVDGSDRGIHKQRLDIVSWSLEDFMKSFSQYECIGFIARIEYKKPVKINVGRFLEQLKTAFKPQL